MRAARRGARARPRPAATASWSSTTTRPTAPARSPTALADELEAVEVLHRPGKGGLGPAYLAGFDAALAGGAGPCWRWTPTSPTTRPTCARLLRGRARARRPGAGLALRAGRRGDRLGRCCGGRSAAAGCWYAQRVLGLRRARPHRRVQVLPPRGAGGDRPPQRALARATPSRSSSPTARCGAASGSSRCRSCSTSAARAQQDVGAIALEAIWRVPQLRSPPRRGRVNPSAPPVPMPDRDAERQRPRAGPGRSATPARTLADWNRRPGPCCGRGWLAALAIAVVLLVAVWVIARCRTPDSTPILLPGLNTPGHARRRRPRAVSQLARARAARVRLRRGLHRRLARCRSRPSATAASGAGSTTKAGPLAIGFVVVRDDLLALHPGLRARRRRLDARRPARDLPRRCCSSACCPTPCPSWSRSSSRWRRGSSPAGAATGTSCSPPRS